MLELTKQEVFQFYQKNKDIWDKSKTELSEKILLESGLSIKKEDKISQLVSGSKDFLDACEIVRKRLIRLIETIKNKKQKFNSDPTSNDVFFDLRQFPSLVDNDPASQTSQSSRTSDISDLEIEIPLTTTASKVKRSFPFQNVGSKSKKMKTQELFDLLLETAEKEEIPPEQLAAYLGYRASYAKDKKIASVFHDLSEGKLPTLAEVEPSLALYIRESCQIGRNIYTDIRLALKDVVLLPAHQHLAKLEANIQPKLEVFEHGWRMKLRDALSMTLTRIFQVLEEKLVLENVRDTGLVCKFVGGCDGSGNHAIYNSATSLAEGVDTSHMLVSGFALTEIKTNNSEGKVIFTDIASQSSNAERPLILCPGRETKENFQKVMEILDMEITSVMSEPMIVNNISCSITFCLSQLDGKAITTASGLGGAYCTSCKVTEADAKNQEKIKEGFQCDRNIDELHELFSTLTGETNTSNILPRPNDYATRQGLTQKPQTHQDITKNIPITHAYIRALSFFERLVYHINGNVRKMGKGVRYTEEEKQEMKEAREIFIQEAAKGPLHMRLDQPGLNNMTLYGISSKS